MTETALPTPQIPERFADCARRFNTRFEQYFRELADSFDAPPSSRFTPECLDLLRDLSLRGGKRLRVAMLYEAARLVTPDPVPGLEEAALGVELLQTHGLVHDDIIDDGPVRRGGPSTYYAYREQFPDRPQDALGLAVLAGDLALVLSLRVLLDSPAPPSARHAMVGVLSAAASAMIAGQITDIERDFTHLPSEELLHAVSDYKTAHYSILAPVQLGLLAAGEDPARFDAELRRYARLVGIYETMRDDYLDLFGDARTMGKSTGSDLRDGKRSYTITAVLAAVNGTERAVVEAALGAPSCTPQTVAAVREIAVSRGVEQKLRADMRRYAELASAEAAAWRPRWREEAVTVFEHLPLWSVERLM
ncbi:polyprenyl synthetase [Streptomyces ambofaciens]|uniref:Polyprenyl synthetase n=1 Tax=Streptomyces ambofaciens TaxID=1889 RepID=Q0JWJ5_STRAM|nr:polyprenyl synthetase family protein [Streptomyces ambofaciens]ANB04042.1 polyprenyl synthetase [Streptomyces ambofaciens]ANB10798.1 polyprenyl synthetase [Streptomyces ambofaciens]CAK50932.1 putative polyprenyl synthetase [Streptomyces ambofaciens]CAK51170.1 putative polyprenyl synthetase [Streptomyces ambofaciens]